MKQTPKIKKPGNHHHGEQGNQTTIDKSLSYKKTLYRNLVNSDYATLIIRSTKPNQQWSQHNKEISAAAYWRTEALTAQQMASLEP